MEKQFDASEKFTCEDCGETKPRRNEDGTKNFHDVCVPTICESCLANRRKQRKALKVMQTTEPPANQSQKNRQTGLRLSDHSRTLLFLLATTLKKTQSELVDSWVKQAVSELPSETASYVLGLAATLLKD